jgi:hypothetical protein
VQLLVLALSLAASPDLPVLGQSAIDRELSALLPTDSENRWMVIPWRTNIMAAIEEGRRAGKPIFLWVMNGNPLGCA